METANVNVKPICDDDEVSEEAIALVKKNECDDFSQPAGNIVTITQAVLDSFNGEQVTAENKIRLDDIGGVDGLMRSLEVNPKTGLTISEVTKMKEKFGDNSFVESPLESYFSLLIGALSDTTLLILLAAAAVSLAIGIVTDPETGYIEGTAIFIAVFLVSNISAGNDYSKQLQFRALEGSSAKDERVSVFREAQVERINPGDLVVGDIIMLQVSKFKNTFRNFYK